MIQLVLIKRTLRGVDKGRGDGAFQDRFKRGDVIVADVLVNESRNSLRFVPVHNQGESWVWDIETAQSMIEVMSVSDLAGRFKLKRL